MPDQSKQAGKPPVAPVAAATILLLRDSANGPEVFMVKRHHQVDFTAGALVFPGGKVDAQDLAIARSPRVDAPTGALHASLGEAGLDAEAAAALFVAACRETLEEAGVLFAGGIDAPLAQRARERACADGGFAGMLEALDVTLAASSLVPWTRWVTPREPALMNRRFDARFFVAALPAGQLAAHDDYEATDSAWMRPAVALERYGRGEIVLAPVQIMSLAHLAEHASVEAILDEARSRLPPLIEPELIEHGGARGFAYPGHERHPVRTRAMPGPTCLMLRGERFEPPDGFESLFPRMET